MKQIVKLTAMLLLISVNVLFAQQKKSDSLTFSGTLTDMDHAKHDWELVVGSVSDGNFHPPGSTKSFKPRIDQNGKFHFKLPNRNEPHQFAFLVYKRTNTGLGRVKIYSNEYFTEPGDSINMNIVIELDADNNTIGSSTKFTGVGSAKYNLVHELQNDYDREYMQSMHLWSIYSPGLGLQTPIDSAAIDYRMYGMFTILKSFQVKKSNLITSADVSPQIRKIINYEYGGFKKGINCEWTTLSKLVYDNHPNFREQIGRIYLRRKKYFIKEPDDSVMKYCSAYVEERMQSDLFEQIIKNRSKDVKFDVFYNQIKANYSGILRERILGKLLTNKRVQGYFLPIEKAIMESLLNDGLALAKIPYIKNAIKGIIVQTRNINEKVINTEFTKLDGTKFELKSLAGKVILLDVWFNGCFGCAEFHKYFKKIYQKFKDNKDFVVLSVNVDKDRNRWVKGIESNLYTSKDDYIQVTTANWFEHPFMEHYNIRGASYSMVIDADGKILVSNARTFEELSAEIAKALKKSTPSS